MKKNIIVLFGINGVGKSTIARMLCNAVQDSVYLSGSSLLMQAFRGLNRQQLEALSPEEKMRMLRPAFFDALKKHQKMGFIILDTHLVVPIRKEERLILENVWPGALTPCIVRAFLVLSDPEDVLRRRKRDYESMGRVRDLNIDHIRRDQEINRSVFEETFITSEEAFVTYNRESRIEETVEFIMRSIT